MTQPRILATMVVGVDFEGPVTKVTLRQLTPEEKTEVYGPGRQSINEDLTADVVGEGIARCRKDDHYDEIVGLELATARALVDFGTKCEAKAHSIVMSQREFEAYNLAQIMGSFARLIQEGLRRLA